MDIYFINVGSRLLAVIVTGFPIAKTVLGGSGLAIYKLVLCSF